MSMKERIGISQILTITASIVAIVSAIVVVAVQLRERRSEIQIQLVSAERLTTPIEVPGLSSQFIYNSQRVTDLWILRLRFVNSGKTTIIGEGPKSDILRDGIRVGFGDNVGIIYAQADTSTFPHETERYFSGLRLSFLQWQSNEYATYLIYLSASEVLEEAPFPMIYERNLINGDVVCINLADITETGRLRYVDKLPDLIVTIGTWVGISLLIVILFIIVYGMIFYIPIGTVRYNWWKSKWSGLLRQYLENNSVVQALEKDEDIQELIDSWVIRPWLIDKEFLTEYKGKLVDEAPSVEPIYGALLTMAGGLLLAVAMIVLIASAIPIH